MQVPTDALIETLPVGIQQRVEILKVLQVCRRVDPRRADSRPHAAGGGGVLHHRPPLRDAGKAIVFITHKLHEILEIADRVSVLRQGRVVGTGQPDSFSEADLAEMMAGWPVSFSVEQAPRAPVMQCSV